MEQSILLVLCLRVTQCVCMRTRTRTPIGLRGGFIINKVIVRENSQFGKQMGGLLNGSTSIPHFAIGS